MVLLFAYTLIRAALLSITHDEALMYNLLKQTSFADIFLYKILAQDHMLNTLLMRFLSEIFGPSVFVLRLPNLIGHLLFLVFSYLILRKTLNGKILAAAFILLNFNPYMLDFFSIARGYGLSTGLMMPSLYFILNYAKNNKLKNLIWSYLFGLLSVLTVVTMLYYFAALIGWTLLYLVLNSCKGFKNKNKLWQQLLPVAVILLSIVLLFLLLKEPISRITGKGFIQQQYETNFFSRTIQTMFASAGYSRYSGLAVAVLSYVLVASFAVATYVQIRKLLKSKMSSITSPGFILYFLGMSIAIGTTILHYWNGTRFLDNRLTVFLMPLLLLTPIYLLNDLFNANDIGKKTSIILSYSLTFLFILNMVTAANFTHYIDWKYDASTKMMMKEIKQLRQEQTVKGVSIGINWFFEPAINYYREVYDMEWVTKVNRNGIEHKTFDFYYVSSEVIHSPVFDSCVLLKEYPVSQTVLFKRSILE